jgi:outer membrane murein-binding lipoprotein Lpp
MEASHIAELKAQVRALIAERDAAREKINRIMLGLEGCCMTCEPIGARNQQMERDIETLKAERDLLRREVCRHRAAAIQDRRPEDIAAQLQWDCFRESTLDRLAQMDEENGL